MSRRNKNNDEAVSLFPFMSILACLIGILTLMISVSMQANEQQSNSNADEARALAIENRDLKKLARELSEAIRKAETRLAKESSTSAELAKLKDRKNALTMDLNKLKIVDDPKKSDAELQNMIDLMNAETAALIDGRPPLSKRLDDLKAALAKRKDPPKKVESVVIRPSGSGVRGATRLFFVECNSTGIVLIGEKGGTNTVSTEAITSSLDYATFLENVKQTRDSTVLYLIRRDGLNSYQWAAGIAESKFEVNTSTLPVPNNGTIDLSLFK